MCFRYFELFYMKTLKVNKFLDTEKALEIKYFIFPLTTKEKKRNVINILQQFFCHRENITLQLVSVLKQIHIKWGKNI